MVIFVHKACSGSRSAWPPASCAVARRRCGWIPMKPMRSPMQTLVSSEYSVKRVLLSVMCCACLIALRLCCRAANPKTGEGWLDYQEASHRSLPCSLPQEYFGTPQGTSHGLRWVIINKNDSLYFKFTVSYFHMVKVIYVLFTVTCKVVLTPELLDILPCFNTNLNVFWGGFSAKTKQDMNAKW